MVLYGCETWSLIKGGTQTEGVEGRVLRRIYEPTRDEVRGCRKLHNEDLLELYSSPSIIRMMASRSWDGVGSTDGEKKNVIG
jgi:hypothetical protein